MARAGHRSIHDNWESRGYDVRQGFVYPPDAPLRGGDMLFKVAFVLLFLWLLGMAGIYQVGDVVHVLLLVGLMLLMMAFIKARDAARRRTIGNVPDKR